MKIICLDAETTDRGEILELSVFDADGAEIYQQYFRPEHARRWRTDIHHITPAMVADKPSARKCLPSIQRIIDAATHILGFAVDNDIRILGNAGVARLDKKKIIEVRQWYWFCRGRHAGVDINGGPGLTTVAAELGVDLSDDAAHSASADTRATLQCFNILAEEFQTKYAPGGADNPLPAEELLSCFDTLYDRERIEVLRRRAHGKLYLIHTPKGHRIVRSMDKRPETPLATIEVPDRFKAELDLRRAFARRRSRDSQIHYALRPADIEAFKAYTNTFDPDDSELCKRLLSRSDHSAAGSIFSNI